MKTVHAKKNAVWQGFCSRMHGFEQLLKTLQEAEAAVNVLQELVLSERRSIELATGLSWAEIEEAFSGRLSSQQSQPRVEATRQIVPKDSLFHWVLRAIMHYQDRNTQSRIDAKAIRIYFDTKAPTLLSGRSPNAISNAVHSLKKAGLIRAGAGGSSRYDRSQYRLTKQGRSIAIERNEA